MTSTGMKITFDSRTIYNYMKPILLILFFLYCFGPCRSQEATTVPLAHFTELKVYDFISVILVPGDDNKLVLHTEDREFIQILESDGVLKLNLASSRFLSNLIPVELHYKQPLTVIDANTNAKITSKAIFKGIEIEIMAQEAAFVSLVLETEFTSIKGTSGSEIHLKGSSKVQDIYVNTGSKVFCKDLLAKETMAMVLAGGYAEVHGTDKVVTKVKAGSTVVVYGKPKKLEKDQTFGGKIEVRE